MIPWAGIVIGPVGSNEQPRRRDFDTDVARGIGVANAAITKQGTGARGEVGGRTTGTARGNAPGVIMDICSTAWKTSRGSRVRLISTARTALSPAGDVISASRSTR